MTKIGIHFSFEGGAEDSAVYYLPSIPRLGEAVQLPRLNKKYVSEIIHYPALGGFYEPTVEIVLEDR